MRFPEPIFNQQKQQNRHGMALGIQNMAILKGQFTGQVFSNWETMFHIHQFQVEKNRTVNVICRGNQMPVINIPYVVHGYWKHSDIYGQQFVSTKVEREPEYMERFGQEIEELQLALL